jgi:hypothetical protein
MMTLVQAKTGSASVRVLPHEIVYFPPARHTVTAMVDGKAKMLEMDHGRADRGHPAIAVGAFARRERGVFCLSPQKGSIQEHAVNGALVPIRISANFPNDFVLRLE